MEDREEALGSGRQTPEAPSEPMVYRNFANNYGADIRNYANGYRGMQESQPEPEEKPLWPWVLADGLLLAAIAGVLIWWRGMGVAL